MSLFSGRSGRVRIKFPTSGDTPGSSSAAAPDIPQTNLILWLEADYGTYAETTRVTPQSTNGGVVKGWADRSSAANHVSNAATSGTTLKTNAINTTRPSIAFDGAATTGFTFTSDLDLNTGHVFAILQNTDGANGSVFLATTATNLTYMHLTASAFNIALSGSSTATAAAGAGFSILQGKTDATTVSAAVNGGAYVPVTSGTNLTYDRFGVYPPGTQFNMVGDFVALIIYSAVQSGADLTTILTYLNTKYAVY